MTWPPASYAPLELQHPKHRRQMQAARTRLRFTPRAIRNVIPEHHPATDAGLYLLIVDRQRHMLHRDLATALLAVEPVILLSALKQQAVESVPVHTLRCFHQNPICFNRSSENLCSTN